MGVSSQILPKLPLHQTPLVALEGKYIRTMMTQVSPEALAQGRKLGVYSREGDVPDLCQTQTVPAPYDARVS